MDPQEVQKQGRDENTQEDYTLLWNNGRKQKQEVHPISAVYAADVG